MVDTNPDTTPINQGTTNLHNQINGVNDFINTAHWWQIGLAAMGILTVLAFVVLIIHEIRS